MTRNVMKRRTKNAYHEIPHISYCH